MIVIDALSYGLCMCGVCKEQFRRLYSGYFIITGGAKPTPYIYAGIDLCLACLTTLIETGKQEYSTEEENYYGWIVNVNRLIVRWKRPREHRFNKKKIVTDEMIVLGPALMGIRNSLG